MNWISDTLSHLGYEYCFGDENDYNDFFIIGKEKPSLEFLEETYKQIKANKNIQERQSKIQKLLLESDYTELPSFIQRKGKEIYNQWMNYRSNLRAAYHDPSLPIPGVPL